MVPKSIEGGEAMRFSVRLSMACPNRFTPFPFISLPPPLSWCGCPRHAGCPQQQNDLRSSRPKRRFYRLGAGREGPERSMTAVYAERRVLLALLAQQPLPPLRFRIA